MNQVVWVGQEMTEESEKELEGSPVGFVALSPDGTPYELFPVVSGVMCSVVEVVTNPFEEEGDESESERELLELGPEL